MTAIIVISNCSVWLAISRDAMRVYCEVTRVDE